ncbi:SKR-1 protein [Aphelenchoides avenae]|nr:SKR-1 protein [Aphelenchus avenae]
MPQQVICETSDQQQIAVELEVLRLSPTFDDMYKNLGLEEEGGEFPGTFPVKNIEARVFKKVVDWCKAHKGQPDPVSEKDPFTKECTWFEFTDDDRAFFDMPSPELLKLVMAANYLDIRGLYQYGCQAIAGLIKGKETVEARHVLQQHFDFFRDEVRRIRSQSPWLNPKADVVGMPVSNPIHIPTEMLTTIFEKLTRADLERLQLVNKRIRNIILHNDELPLHLLDEVHFDTSTNDWTGRRRYSSWETLNREHTDLLACRKLLASGHWARSPYAFMHLPAILSCNHLDMREVRFGWQLLAPAHIVKWLEHESEKTWDEPRQLDLREGQLRGDLVRVVDALKKAFLSAATRKPYVLRLHLRRPDDNHANEVLSNATGEQLRIRLACRYWWILERK